MKQIKVDAEVDSKPLKPRLRWQPVALGTSCVAILAGGFVLLNSSELSLKWPFFGSSSEVGVPSNPVDLEQTEGSEVLALAKLTPAQRRTALEAIATQPDASLERSRARYLLASDLVAQNQVDEAIAQLQGLEAEYAPMAPYVLYLRAKAYESMARWSEADQAWKALLQRYPDEPVAAEALYALGTKSSDPTYWDQAIQQFPSHPKTIQLVQERLADNPDQPQLMMLLVRYGLYLPDIIKTLDTLVEDHAEDLTPDDWGAIAFAYWEKGLYSSAGKAYAKATPAPLNRYRAARGAHLGDRIQDAIQAYQTLDAEFPDAQETAQGLIHLASLTSNDREAIGYLDQVIDRFPSRAAEALVDRADRLESLGSRQSAMQARQSVLTQYSDSEAAAELRWQQAELQFQKGNTQAAWQWARQLVDENPDSDLAPEAGFWLGKWSLQLNKRQDAVNAFGWVLKYHPESYYAWRSATALGWDVGDFNTVRFQQPVIQPPLPDLELAAGSEVLHELYRLGQDQDAWTLWQVEFRDRVQPTVDEQFTDGVLRLGVGDNLEGIFMVDSLSWRDLPEDEADYQELRRHPAYWQALYPFLYTQEVEDWAAKRQLNPMLVWALIRQESRFEAKIQSPVGATGLMQVMPDTADWIADQSDDIGDYTLSNPNDNIELGTWYLDYTHGEYNNNSLFAIASYNAGPGNVADWIDRFPTVDPDVFIEQIPFSETKGYVEAVFENYWNYLRIYNPDVSKRLADFSPAHATLLTNQPEP
jgi:soluble lytic murein transglycosylase